MTYQPDRWVIIHINRGSKDELYKVLAGWAGSYLYGESWKINSGITKVEEDEEFYYFHGYSGSIYQCHKGAYGLTIMTAGILENLKDQATNYNYVITLLKEEEIHVLRQTHG